MEPKICSFKITATGLLDNALRQISNIGALWFHTRTFNFSEIFLSTCKMLSPGRSLTQAHNLNDLDRATLNDASSQISEVSAVWFVKIFQEFVKINLCKTSDPKINAKTHPWCKV